MIHLQKAVIAKLRSIQTLAAATGYSESHLSIAMANPDQELLKPGIYVELDVDPLPASDSSQLRRSILSMYVITADRKTGAEIAGIIRDQFYDENGKEKKLDIGDDKVLCIGSYWESMQNPRWNKDTDCFETLVVVTVVWSKK